MPEESRSDSRLLVCSTQGRSIVMKIAVIWGTLGALIIGAASAAPASAAAAETPRFGVVDMDRVAGEYRQMHELNQQFQDFQRDQERQLQERHKTRLLTEAEGQEYADMSATAAPTDANRKRVQELEALSGTREQRLLELRQKKELTAEEEAEAKQWADLYEKSMTELTSLQAELQASRVAKYEELSKVVADNVTNAVKSVAEEQKLTLVLRKDAVLYGGTDITEAVLTKLNGPAAAQK
jgi:outer membrane protein